MEATPKENKGTNIPFINGNITDKNLNQSNILLLHTSDSIACKNYGISCILVEKYPYCDIAGLRCMDMDFKRYARKQDRSEEGTAYIHSPPLYTKGVKIGTLISQYGPGPPYEENKESQNFIRNCQETPFRCGKTPLIKRLREDTVKNIIYYFNKSLFSLANILKREEYFEVKKIVIPIGIGCRGVDEVWLKRYYNVITKFVHEVNFYGKKCYILITEEYFKQINKYVENNCSDEAICILNKLKSANWTNINEKWYVDEGLTKLEEGYDVPDTQRTYVLNQCHIICLFVCLCIICDYLFVCV